MPAKPSQGATIEEVPAFDGGKFVVSESDNKDVRPGEDQFSMRHEATDGTGSHPSLEGAKKLATNKGITVEQPSESAGQTSPSGVADTGDPLYDNFPGERNERGYLEDVSEPVFANGGVQLPGSDPWAVSEIISDGVDPETLSLLTNEYEKESGTEVPGILVGYTGPLDMDSFNQYASDQAQYNEAFVGEQDMYDAEDFLDWLGSKAETETQKMVKMMQKHNVDNTRRDPIILSNKAGKQRR